MRRRDAGPTGCNRLRGGADRLAGESGATCQPLLTDNPHIVHARNPRRIRNKRPKLASVIVGPPKVAPVRADARERLLQEMKRRAITHRTN
jgi:hypothetical protein